MPENTRAQSMAVDDRRAMLIDAVTPLLLEFGTAVTTKQIAEAAGIAEGTIFRAFETKEELLAAAVAKSLDPAEFRDHLLSIDLSLPLEDRLRELIVILQERFSRVYALMTSVGPHVPPHNHDDIRREFAVIVRRLVGPDLARLNVAPERAAQVIRMVALAASVPRIRNGDPFDAAEIASLILYGITGAPTPPRI